MTFYIKCTITSYYSVVLLKQTTKMKTLPIANVTQFHNFPVMSQTVSHSRGLCRSTDTLIWPS